MLTKIVRKRKLNKRFIYLSSLLILFIYSTIFFANVSKVSPMSSQSVTLADFGGNIGDAGGERMPTDELTRDDLVTILLALQSEIERWQRHVAMGDDRPELEQYDQEQLGRFQAVRDKVEARLYGDCPS